VKENWLLHKVKEEYMLLDTIDLKILELLSRDGRISHTAIGKEVGLTAPSVYARVQQLEQEGIIKGYTVLLDPEKLGHGLVAFIRVGLQASVNEAEPFERFILQEPQIVECYDVDGEDCYILKVRTTSPQMLRELIAHLRSLPRVTRTVTSIVLLTIKEEESSGATMTHTTKNYVEK
jgi:Lrp/AsnC family transcriptional regulator, leucine-responsive regulatory protein